MANTNLFKIFIEVANNGSITKASEKLYISQPAITKSIKQLELELGGNLFERKNRGVELTTEGKYIYDKVLPLINDLDNVYSYFDDVKKLKTGVLRIGTTTSNITLLISNTLNSFILKYPNVEIKITRAKESSIFNQLRNNELDLAFMDSNMIKPDVNEVAKFNVNYSVVGNKDYFNKYNTTPLSIEEFALSPLALISTSNTSRKNIDSFFNNFGLKLNAKYEMENYGLIIDLIKRGVAIGIVNLDYFKQEVKNNEIFCIKTAFQIDKRTISLVKSNKEFDNPAKKIFIEMLNSTKG